MNDDPFATVDRHHDVDLGADQDEEVVGDVALPEEELPLVDLASNPQLGDQPHVSCVQRRKGLVFICHGANPLFLRPPEISDPSTLGRHTRLDPGRHWAAWSATRFSARRIQAGSSNRPCSVMRVTVPSGERTSTVTGPSSEA